MLSGGEFEVDRNQDTTRVEHRIRRDEPLRLVRHDDRGSISVGKTRGLQGRSDQLRSRLEVAVSESTILTFAVGFDETEMFLPLIQSDTKCFAEG